MNTKPTPKQIAALRWTLSATPELMSEVCDIPVKKWMRYEDGKITMSEKVWNEVRQASIKYAEFCVRHCAELALELKVDPSLASTITKYERA